MSGVRGWPIALAVVSLTPLSLFCVCGLLFPTAVVTLLPSPASSDSTLAGVGCCVAALLAPAGGLRVGLWVCSVVFGCSRAVMSDRFSLASLLLFWPFCWLSGRDLLGFFGLCLLVFLGCWLPSLNLGCMKPKVNPGQKNKTKQILKKKKKNQNKQKANTETHQHVAHWVLRSQLVSLLSAFQSCLLFISCIMSSVFVYT